MKRIAKIKQLGYTMNLNIYKKIKALMYTFGTLGTDKVGYLVMWNQVIM